MTVIITDMLYTAVKRSKKADKFSENRNCLQMRTINSDTVVSLTADIKTNIFKHSGKFSALPLGGSPAFDILRS